MTDTARLPPDFGALDPGAHLCWLLEPGDDFAAGVGAFAARGASAGHKVLLVGGADEGCGTDLETLTTLNPRAMSADSAGVATAVLDTIRREADLAGRGGYRGLRVVTRMDRVVRPGCGIEDLVGYELGLSELAAGTGTSVVCAYEWKVWEPQTLRDVACMHSDQLGRQSLPAGFHLTYADIGCWKVDGVVDFTSAIAFGAAVRAALARTVLTAAPGTGSADPDGAGGSGGPGGCAGGPVPGRLRLIADGLDLIDAAGLRTLANSVRAVPGTSIRIQGANSTVRKMWRLSGFDTPRVAVELEP